MQAGPFFGRKREREGDLWARVGIFGHSQALRPVLGEPHGGAPPYSLKVNRSPPGASLAHLFSLPSFVASCMLSALDKQLLDWNKKDVSCFSPHRCSLKVNISCLCSRFVLASDPLIPSRK